MMQKLNIAFFCQNKKNIDYVFGEKRLSEIAQLGNLNTTVIQPENIDNAALEEIDILFSTWGMFVPTDEQFKRLKRLKVLFYAAGATDPFCRPFLERGVHVISAWRANSIPVAEYCFSQIILGLKNYFQIARNYTAKERTAEMKTKIGRGCYGARVALIGAGAIATKVQELLKNCHVETLVIPSRKERRTVDLDTAFATSQIVSNHLPDREDNTGILNGKLFRSMQKDAVFINTGRGRQVNEPELIEVLKERPDLSALLDVTFPEPPDENSELYTLPNVFLTPHIAGSLNDEVKRMADFMILEFKNYLAQKPFQYEVTEKMLLTSQ
ncbi:MAG: hydroxyacid dehydrogenase [Lentisphaeria bacterium]